MKKVAIGLGVVVLLCVVLGLMPARIEPLPWKPPPSPPLVGPYALNERLKPAVQLQPTLSRPEELSVDPAGNLVTALADGRVVRMAPDGSGLTELVNTGGRPLGLKYAPDGRLIICDARKGLLALGTDGKLETLATEVDGRPLKVLDDLDIAPDGVVYFSEASTRHVLEKYTDDILEHRPSGSLLSYDPATKKVTTVVSGLSFANGVAFGPSPDWLVVNETGENKIWRVWVGGPRKGEKEVFIDALPGFPDNITWSPSRGVFWLAVFGPRDPLVDALGGLPTVRKIASHFPTPPLKHHAFALAIDPNGKPVESLQWDDGASYSPVTSVLERDGYLYFGSIEHDGYARLKL